MLKIELFKRSILNVYVRDKDNNTPLDTLAYFLSTDCFYEADFFLDWLKSSVYINAFTGGNLCILIFDGKNIIIDTDSNPDHADRSKSFITSKEKLVRIIEKWQQLVKKLPEKITLTVDKNGNVELVAK